MDILTTLRKYGISKSKMANDFNLSRPTLDEYISKFENEEPLPKMKYQKAFFDLFKDSITSKIFYKKYTMLAEEFKKEKEISYRKSLNEGKTLIREIDYNLRKIWNDEDDGMDVLRYIRFITSRYKVNKTIILSIQYYNLLNNLNEEYSFTSAEEKYIGELHYLNNLIQNDQKSLLNISNNHYKEFLISVDDAKKDREERILNVKNSIENLLYEYVNEVFDLYGENCEAEDVKKKVLQKIAIENR